VNSVCRDCGGSTGAPRSVRCRRCFESSRPDERFWAKVNKTDGCWIWTAAKTRGGYGNFGLGSKRYVRAHRLAWELTYGSIPAGMFVCHRCDNPPCVNPSHLFLGTSSDNLRDCVAKGRHVPYRTTAHKGEGNPNAKLTVESVREIRAAAKRGERLDSIAARYGVSVGGIRHVVAGERWGHVA
jgi:hypothetical protein